MSKDKTSLGSPIDKERFESKISLSQIADFTSDIEGKILTVIDASMTEQKQREAVKSLVRQYIWSDFDKVREWFYSQTENTACSFPFNPNLPERAL